MGRSILVVAPHPDDETLGCGGTLLRHGAEGDALHWVVVTSMTAAYSAEQRARRAAELQAVARHYGFASTAELGFTTAALDAVPRGEVVERMSENETRRVIVAQEWELKGIITGGDVANWLDRAGLVGS